MQAVLKHSFSPSKVANLVGNLKGMRSEIRACLEKLESTSKHVNDLYTINHNRLERVVTSSSTVSTSTILPARIKLAGWLKRREEIWRLGTRSTSTKVRLQWRCCVLLSKYDFSSVIFFIQTTYRKFRLVYSARYSVIFALMGPSHFATCSLFQKRSTLQRSMTILCGRLYPLMLNFSAIFGDGQSNKLIASPSNVFVAAVHVRSAFE